MTGLEPAVELADGRAAGIVLVVVLGLGAGAALVAIWARRGRIGSARQLAEIWPAPLLARLPGPSPWRPRWLDRSQKGMVAEDVAFRWLALELGLAPGRSRCVMVTSVAGTDGKTRVTASLALRLASEGQSVVAIDVDLLRPTLAQTFRVPPEPNLGTGLRSGRLADAARTVTGIPSLRVVAGVGDARIATLAALGERLPDLVGQARAEGSHVLLETTPLDESPDVLALLDAVDELILVASAGRTRVDVLDAMRERLERYGRAASGFVLIGTALALPARTRRVAAPPAALPEVAVADASADGRPGAGQELLSPGDRVQWNCGRHTAAGIIERRLTAPTTVGGRRVAASEAEPRYLIRSERSGKQAARRAGALVKVPEEGPPPA
jgi:Mrp family chromosome partitioning ATPase